MTFKVLDLSLDAVYMWTGRTPCHGRLYDALPEESRTARVKLLLPKGVSGDIDLVVHLAGTGDHGFERRMHLGFPLIAKACMHAPLMLTCFTSTHPTLVNPICRQLVPTFRYSD